jgi:hypothetical protein
MCLSSDYNSLVSGFVGNTNIHAITHVSDTVRNQYSKNYATEYYKIDIQHTPTIDNQHYKEEEDYPSKYVKIRQSHKKFKRSTTNT